LSVYTYTLNVYTFTLSGYTFELSGDVVHWWWAWAWRDAWAWRVRVYPRQSRTLQIWCPNVEYVILFVLGD
jgi:hypothetical protein